MTKKPNVTTNSARLTGETFAEDRASNPHMDLREEAQCVAEALMERSEPERILFMAHLARFLEIMATAPTLTPEPIDA